MGLPWARADEGYVPCTLIFECHGPLKLPIPLLRGRFPTGNLVIVVACCTPGSSCIRVSFLCRFTHPVEFEMLLSLLRTVCCRAVLVIVVLTASDWGCRPAWTPCARVRVSGDGRRQGYVCPRLQHPPWRWTRMLLENF